MNKLIITISIISIIIIASILFYRYYELIKIKYDQIVDNQDKKIEELRKTLDIFNNIDINTVSNYIDEIQKNNREILDLKNIIEELNNDNIELLNLINILQNNNNNINVELNGLEISLNTLQMTKIPKNTIIAYSGSSIPDGWVECDGSNGTADLRSRMIVGRNITDTSKPFKNLGDRGGSEKIMIKSDNLPSYIGVLEQQPIDIMNQYHTLIYIMKI